MFGFWIVYTLIAAPCVFYTPYTLTAHTPCPWLLTIVVYIFLIVGWFSMPLIWNLRTSHKLTIRQYTIISQSGYFLLGFAFLLLSLLAIRDTIWMSLYIFSPFKIPSPFEAPAIIWANLLTVCFAVILSLYTLFEAQRQPRVIHYKFHDKRVLRPLKILLMSDWHINKTISPQKVREYVCYFNSLQPDIIALAGDIVDDTVSEVKDQLKELKKLRAQLGIFVTLGNHEVYFDPLQWEAAYAALGWQVLHNSGVSLNDCGIYIGGVPSFAGFKPNPLQALRQSTADKFRILLAHEPSVARLADSSVADIQFSGHTHGGQIFPFHFPVKLGNSGYISGSYQSGKTRLLISNGVGYWGPPMRLFAPSDVVLVSLYP